MQRRVTRRHALQAVGTALGASVVSTRVTAQKATATDGGATGSGSEPTPTAVDTDTSPTVAFDYGGYLDATENYDGRTVDARGQSAVKIDVGATGNGGALAFDPPAVWVDPGTSVVWNWTGEGGPHSVVAEDVFDSGSATEDPEATVTYRPDETGVIEYYCEPHDGLGMRGVLAVGVIEQAADAVTETATSTDDPATRSETDAGGDGASGDGTTTTLTTETVTETTRETGTTADATADGGDATATSGPGFTALTVGAGVLGALGLERLRRE